MPVEHDELNLILKGEHGTNGIYGRLEEAGKTAHRAEGKADAALRCWVGTTEVKGGLARIDELEAFKRMMVRILWWLAGTVGLTIIGGIMRLLLSSGQP